MQVRDIFTEPFHLRLRRSAAVLDLTLAVVSAAQTKTPR